VEIIGPKFARIFQTPKSTFSPLYKHSFEPRVVYLYQRVSQAPGIIPFDEKDVIGGIQNSVQYSLTTRLFAKRAGSTPQAPETAGGGLFPPGSPMAGEAPAPTAPPPSSPEEKASLSPVEIASFSLAQSYSFLDPAVHPVRTAFTCPSVPGPAGTSIPDPNCLQSRLSDVSLQARLNPTLFFSVDARGTYDIFFNTFRNGSLSANYRDPARGFLNFSWFFQNALGPFDVESKQLGLLAGTNLLNRRLTVGFQGHYDVVQGLLQDQRYVLGYNTQCCGFTVELLDRNFSGFNDQQFRLMLNLKGIGNVLDINSGASPVPGLPVGF
jgi:lipopolysaccharide transport LptD-like protein